jgi:hypothetical protein
MYKLIVNVIVGSFFIYILYLQHHKKSVSWCKDILEFKQYTPM